MLYVWIKEGHNMLGGLRTLVVIVVRNKIDFVFLLTSFNIFSFVFFYYYFLFVFLYKEISLSFVLFVLIGLCFYLNCVYGGKGWISIKNK